MSRRLSSIVVAVALSLALPRCAAAQTGSTGGAQAPGVRVLRVGTSGDYAPFSFQVQSDAVAPAGAGAPPVALSGFDIEIARRFAASLGYQVEFVRFQWPELARDLAAGRFDVAMSGVTMRADRSVLGRFTVPVAQTQAIALSWKAARASTVRQLNRRTCRIAVNAGGYLEGVARKVFPLSQIIALPSNEAVRMALLDRSTDAVITDNLEEKQWTKGVAGVVRIGPLSNASKAYLVRADREQLAEELDAWLLAREHDGMLASLRSSRLQQDAALPVATPLVALISTVSERMSLMPLVWAAKHKAGQPIEDESQEARVLDAAVAATSEAAGQASRPAPDAERVRAFFRSLIEAGKDVQRHLEEEERARARVPAQRKQAANAPAQQESAPAVAGAEPGEKDAASPAPDQSAAEAAARAAQAASEAAIQGRSRAQPAQPEKIALFDLQSEIRPALGRINVKLARLIVAMDTPLSAEAVQRPLRIALDEYRLRPGHLESISDSIAALSVPRR